MYPAGGVAIDKADDDFIERLLAWAEKHPDSVQNLAFVFRALDGLSTSLLTNHGNID